MQKIDRVNERDRHSEIREICVTGEERNKTIRQPRAIIPTGQNKSRKVETILLKLVMKKGRNFKHTVSLTLTLYSEITMSA